MDLFQISFSVPNDNKSKHKLSDIFCKKCFIYFVVMNELTTTKNFIGSVKYCQQCYLGLLAETVHDLKFEMSESSNIFDGSI